MGRPLRKFRPMTEARELKPCPFCGGRSEFTGIKKMRAFCDNCGSAGPDARSLDEAARGWNTRPAPAEPSASTELREALARHYGGLWFSDATGSWPDGSPRHLLDSVPGTHLRAREQAYRRADAALIPPAEATGGWVRISDLMDLADGFKVADSRRKAIINAIDHAQQCRPSPSKTAGAGGVK